MYRQLQQFAFSFVFSLVFWLLLVGSLDHQEPVAGLVVAGAAAVLTLGRPSVLAGLRLSPRAPLAFLAYLAALLVALVRANSDMARRVLTPSLPLRPTLVRINTSCSPSCCGARISVRSLRALRDHRTRAGPRSVSIPGG